MSAESGIQTFRGAGGLWNGKKVEDVASPEGWHKNPKMVLEFYNERRKQIQKAKPNSAHYDLSELQNKHQVIIITQNIDDLHERAGSKHIIHLHGEILKSRSIKNEHQLFDCFSDIHIGDLSPDGAQLRPHIVWFGEMVPMMEKAIQQMHDAEIVIVIGTSMVVYPAASLLYYAPAGAIKYVINPEMSEMQKTKNLICIKKTATEGMKELLNLLSN